MPAAMTLAVPSNTCPESGCGRRLVVKSPIRGQLLTIKYGRIPVLCPSTYCRCEWRADSLFEWSDLTSKTDCNTRFYHNYKIQRASDPNACRQYYSQEIPNFIEVSDHTYVDTNFCDWLRMEIAINRSVPSHTTGKVKSHGRDSSSATNIATIYERVLSKRWSTDSPNESISCTVILDAFFLHALLLESRRNESPLVLPHHGQSFDRLTARMHERNSETAIHGLHHWTHRCEVCFKDIENQTTGETCETPKTT